MRTVRTVRHASSTRNAACVLVALLLAGALAACGGSGDSSESGAARAPLSAQDGGNTTGGGGTGTGSTQNRITGQAPPPARRTVVYTAQLEVRAKNVDAAAAKAKQMALAAGGYVQQESSSWGTDSTITLKIPSGRYAAVLADLSAELGNKLSLKQQAQDVTGEVADVDSRVKSAEAGIASFRKLLDRAGSVSEIMSVEGEIARRQAELEALQARQKALQESTRYATVTVTLSGPPPKAAPSPKKEDPGGFLNGLERGWQDFTAILAVITTVVGWLLPFLGLGMIIGLPVLLIWRRTRSRRPLPPE
jgi:hypothetical protein